MTHCSEQVSNRVRPPYLFDPSIPDPARHDSSIQMLPWSFLALLTQTDRLLLPHIGYSAV
eukprot:44706-Pelagomonas_calceolata.AAC.1